MYICTMHILPQPLLTSKTVFAFHWVWFRLPQQRLQQQVHVLVEVRVVDAIYHFLLFDPFVLLEYLIFREVPSLPGHGRENTS